MKKLIHILCIWSLLLFSNLSHSQDSTRHTKNQRHILTLEDKVRLSDAVVEGVMINHTESSRLLDGHIYNSFVIRVSKIFKGDIKDTIIKVMLPSVGDFLWKGYEGMFFLKSNDSIIPPVTNIQSFFYLIGGMSFMRYQLPYLPYSPTTSDAQKRYDDLESDLYPAIEAVTGSAPRAVGLNSFEAYEVNQFDPKNYKGAIPLSDKVQIPVRRLDDKVNNSDAVVEGRVIATDMFAGIKSAFTSLTIRVSRIFKGEIKDSIIELITDGGGPLPNGSSFDSRWGMLSKGDEGIFFLRDNDSEIQSKKTIQSYFYLYGHSCISYSSVRHSSDALKDQQKDLDFEREFYKPIEAVTGTPAKVIGLNSFEAAKQGQPK